jgi:transporter family protein
MDIPDSCGCYNLLLSLLQFSALKLGDASVVTAMERLSLVFTVILSVLFLKEELNWKVIVGVLLMIGGAVLVSVSRKTE